MKKTNRFHFKTVIWALPIHFIIINEIKTSPKRKKIKKISIDAWAFIDQCRRCYFVVSAWTNEHFVRVYCPRRPHHDKVVECWCGTNHVVIVHNTQSYVSAEDASSSGCCRTQQMHQHIVAVASIIHC